MHLIWWVVVLPLAVLAAVVLAGEWAWCRIRRRQVPPASVLPFIPPERYATQEEFEEAMQRLGRGLEAEVERMFTKEEGE